jgi:peptidoglycan hydrolase CwlO-like protein
MTSSYLFARSLEAKINSFENIWVEIIQNHPGLLHSFTELANTKIETNQIDNSIAKIRDQIANQKSVYSITLMALLETSSANFIPYLEGLAISLGVEDLEYTRIHGVADIKHANQFLESLESEKQYYSEQEFEIQFNLAFENAYELLESIFGF